eukprot:2563322-Rhodomonas_salina.2
MSLRNATSRSLTSNTNSSPSSARLSSSPSSCRPRHTPHVKDTGHETAGQRLGARLGAVWVQRAPTHTARLLPPTLHHRSATPCCKSSD